MEKWQGGPGLVRGDGVFLHRFLWASIPSPGDKHVSFLLVEGGTFQVGVLSLAFRNKKGQSTLITAAISQVLLTQNYQYA